MQSTRLVAALAVAGGLLTATELRVRPPFVVIIGAPGAGKSTQAERLSKRMGAPVLSVEQMIRENEGIYKAAGSRMSGMEKESDPILNRIFGSYLEKTNYDNGLILDGYPSTKDHADYLAKLAKEGQVPPPTVIQLDVPDEVVRKRLAAEAGPSLEQRIKDYHREMDMLALYFPNAKIVKVDASKKPNAVEKQIRKALPGKAAR